MKKYKVLLPLVSLATIATPILTMASCQDPAVTFKDITAELKDGTNEILVGKTLTTDLFNVYAVYSNGKKVLLNYDETGKAGYTVDTSMSSFNLGHTFELKDLSRNNQIRFCYNGDNRYAFSYDVQYSESVKIYANNVTILEVGTITPGSNAIIKYKPRGEHYYTELEQTGVKVNDTKHNAYDEFGTSFKFEYLSESDRTMQLTIDKSILGDKGEFQVQIADEEYEDACVVQYDHDDHCSLIGGTIVITHKNDLWKDVIKPTVKADDTYMFVKWVDENGSEITDDTKITEDIKVKAISASTSIAVTLGTDHCTVSPTLVQVPPGIKWKYVKAQISVTEDDGYKFIGWYDKNGNEIDNDTVISEAFYAKAVCAPIDTATISITLGTGGEWEHPEQKYISVPRGAVWGDYKYLAEFLIKKKTHDYIFSKWTTQDEAQEISDNLQITQDVTFKAIYIPISSWNVKTMEKVGLIRSRYNEINIGREKFLYSETVPGHDYFNAPEFENDRLILEYPNKNDDFRFITDTIEFDITIPAHSQGTVDIDFNLLCETWLNGHFKWSYSNYTAQVFYLGQNPNNHPEYYTNLNYERDPKKCDSRSIYINEAAHFVAWAPPKHFEDRWHTAYSIKVENNSDVIVHSKHYFSISFLIDAETRRAGDHRGKLTTDISYAIKKE